MTRVPIPTLTAPDAARAGLGSDGTRGADGGPGPGGGRGADGGRPGGGPGLGGGRGIGGGPGSGGGRGPGGGPGLGGGRGIGGGPGSGAECGAGERDRDQAPVEYAVAVERYLDAAALGPASRRVYKISLTAWCWPLVGYRPPPGTARRGARPPVVPLALLDEPDARVKLAAAVADRAAHADARTVNRELSALRSAVGWWQDKGWICGDPVTGLRHLAREPEALPALTDEQLAALWRCGAGLREHALWRLIYDSGAPAAAVLALDAGSLDLPAGRVRVIREPGVPIKWSEHTGELLAWLLSGRKTGPVFRTDRRAPPRYQSKDLCPLTGRARMSYRRAAEIFTERTRRLDPAGAGWTLSQLRRPAGR